MKIREAREYYTNQLEQLRQTKQTLQKRLDGLAQQQPSKKDEDATRGVVVELSGQMQKDIERTQKFLSDLNALETGLINAQNSKVAADAAAKEYDNLGKYIETARRIASGGKVPAKDQQKLMEYSFKMYLAAKNAAMMREHASDEEYDSLWDEEDEDTAALPDAEEMAAEHTVPIAAPQIQSFDIEI